METAARDIIGLTRRFLDGEIDAVAFDRSYRDRFSAMPVLGPPLFGILEDLAIACADFVPEPEFRDDDELDEAGLRAAARRALSRVTAEGA